jgi:hypothetical protein
MIHGMNVVHHFVDIARETFTKNLRLGCEQILQRALGTLDLA